MKQTMTEVQPFLNQQGQACLALHYKNPTTEKMARVDLCLQGAHICSYKPDAETELLWMSQTAKFEQGKAIRGGIPICWPWFGAHWSDPKDQPQHGFARTSQFELIDSQADDNATQVCLELGQQAEPYHSLQMQVEVRLSDSLSIQIKTKNLGEQAIEVGAALHTYLAVSHIDKIAIPELQGLQYKDKTKGFELFSQEAPFHIDQETDRVYLNPPSSVKLADSGFNHQMNIESWGNTDLVLWNPWVEAAKAMTDFDNEGYLSMVCIEPANALDNRVLLQPGEMYALGKTIKTHQMAH